MIGSHLRQQLLQCRQLRFRSFSLLHGPGAQDACPKFPWHVYPLSSHGRSSGEVTYLSVWKRLALTVNASSAETQTDEHLWKEYFADASQWWDNRLDKKLSKRTPMSTGTELSEMMTVGNLTVRLTKLHRAGAGRGSSAV